MAREDWEIRHGNSKTLSLLHNSQKLFYRLHHLKHKLKELQQTILRDSTQVRLPSQGRDIDNKNIGTTSQQKETFTDKKTDSQKENFRNKLTSNQNSY